jgi:hypothetical protein
MVECPLLEVESILYIKATMVSICPGSFQALPGQTDRHHYGFVFYDSYYSIDTGGARPGGKESGEGGHGRRRIGRREARQVHYAPSSY